jgi:hypothetical protein
LRERFTFDRETPGKAVAEALLEEFGADEDTRGNHPRVGRLDG